MSAIGSPLVGVFVGGRSSRMGGAPKGLLRAPGGDASIVARTLGLVASLGLDVVLVGDAKAYAEVAPGVPAIADDPPGIGPIGGLRALLRHAGARDAIAIACDLPFVTAELIARLAAASGHAAVVAPRLHATAPWEVLCARYAPVRVLPALDDAIARGVHGLQRVVDTVGAARLELAEGDADALVDWDTPDDVR